MGINPKTIPLHLQTILGVPREPRTKKKKQPRPISEKKAAKIRAWEADMKKLPGVFIPTRCESLNVMRTKHWSDNGRLARQQRQIAFGLARNSLGITAPCAVRFTRYSPGELDEDDNLGVSLKAIRDGVADAGETPDRDKRWTWIYEQAKAPGFGVRIEVMEGN